ncbi:hypothetical protein E2C01_069380 [Portunus trituberculatus]|uniref:Uncharacterized protein n=1 Tax=Portunus trituberculatus TaxID=210409 RepID=A0A5B7I0M3_PORTR|nr:hypothetical protein [Portunus trituberculatus]
MGRKRERKEERKGKEEKGEGGAEEKSQRKLLMPAGLFSDNRNASSNRIGCHDRKEEEKGRWGCNRGKRGRREEIIGLTTSRESSIGHPQMLLSLPRVTHTWPAVLPVSSPLLALMGRAEWIVEKIGWLTRQAAKS